MTSDHTGFGKKKRILRVMYKIMHIGDCRIKKKSRRSFKVIMKKDIRQNVDVSRLNAFSGAAYMYAAISVKDRPIFASSFDGTSDREGFADKKGGIIVFPRKENADQPSKNKLIYWARQRLSSYKDKTSGETAKDALSQRHNLVGWTIGNFFKGRYKGEDGEVYSEDSLSVEIIGASDASIIELAEELCRAFAPKSVLVKSYSERNRIFLVNGE